MVVRSVNSHNPFPIGSRVTIREASPSFYVFRHPTKQPANALLGANLKARRSRKVAQFRSRTSLTHTAIVSSISISDRALYAAGW